jgi:hypothetical protein
VNQSSQYQQIKADLGWIDAQMSQVFQRTTDAMIQPSLPIEQIDIGRPLAVAEWDRPPVAGSEPTDQDLPHAASASASPMLWRMLKASW